MKNQNDFKVLLRSQSTEFKSLLVDFLKRSTEEGFDLDQVTMNIFDEVFCGDEGISSDGTLSTFALMLFDKVHLKQQLGMAVLDVIMPAVAAGKDIYDLVEELEQGMSELVMPSETVQGETSLKKRTKVIVRRPELSIPNVSGIPEGERSVLVIRSRPQK
jgi:hypothetical protein